MLAAVDAAPQMTADDVTTSGVQLNPLYTTDNEGNRLPDGFGFSQHMQVRAVAAGCLYLLPVQLTLLGAVPSLFNMCCSCSAGRWAACDALPIVMQRGHSRASSAAVALTPAHMLPLIQAKVQNLTDDRLAAVIDAVVVAGGDNVTIDSIQVRMGLQLCGTLYDMRPFQIPKAAVVGPQ